MTANILKVGSVVTCQLGNKFDTHGFKKSTTVTVLGHKILSHMPNDPIYLIKEHGVNLVGRATVPFRDREGDEDIVADLYCTAAMNYGDDQRIKTLEEAVANIF